MKATECPINREDFEIFAKPLAVKVGEGNMLGANVHFFSTGSFGWYANGKVTVEVNGIPLTVQVGMNLTVVGSKHLPPPATTAEKKTKKKAG